MSNSFHRPGLIKSNSPGAKRNRRSRLRENWGYVDVGKVDLPPELVPVMIERGYIDPAHVTEDAQGHLRVEPEILTEAWTRLVGRLAAIADELPDILSGDRRCLDSFDFRREIGLPADHPAPLMQWRLIEERANAAGYVIRFRKIKKHPQD